MTEAAKTELQHSPARSKKRGFTLTEIAIVLGIIGLILGAVWVAAASVYNNQRISHANTALLQVVQGVRALMSTSNSMGTAGDVTATMISAGVIPSDLVDTATVPNSAFGPWAGSTLKVLTAAATDNAFTVELNGVPKAGCIGLITVLGGTSRDQGLSAVGATAAAAPIQAGAAGTALALTTTQVAASTPTEATAACTSATTNLVQFEFTLK